MMCRKSSVLLSAVTDFNDDMRGVAWPPELKEITCCSRQAITGVNWPLSLEILSLDAAYSRPWEETSWPVSLRTLGIFRADTPLVEISWPPSLQTFTCVYTVPNGPIA